MIDRTARSYCATISAIRSISPPGSMTTASFVSPHARMVQLHSKGPAGNVSRSSTADVYKAPHGEEAKSRRSAGGGESAPGEGQGARDQPGRFAQRRHRPLPGATELPDRDLRLQEPRRAADLSRYPERNDSRRDRRAAEAH